MSDRSLMKLCPDNEFFGRAREIDYIASRALEAEKRSPNILLFGRRWTGKTEVLRRVHRLLFWSQAKAVPVYYQFKGYGDAEGFAEDFLKETLKQVAAFRRRDAGLVRSEISLERLERLLLDEDDEGLADFISRHREAKRSEDRTAMLRNALAAPQYVSEMASLPVFLILDDLDLASRINALKGGSTVLKELMEALNSGAFSYAASSTSAKVLEGGVPGGSIEALELRGLDEELAVAMAGELCRKFGVECDSEILTLSALKLGGNPMYLKSLVWAAHREGRELVILKDFVDLYASEVSGGSLYMALKSLIHLKGMGELRLLNSCMKAGTASVEELSDRLRITPEKINKSLEELSRTGLLEENLGSIRWAGDGVQKDFVSFSYETRARGRSAEEVRTFLIRDGLKEGFNQKGEKVRSRLKDELTEALRSFNGQKVLKVLFRHQAFAARFKNGVYSIAEKSGEDEITLPQVIGSFETSRLEAGETGHPILAADGFQNSRYDSGNEVVWLVAFKDAASPVNLGDAENFIRRSRLLRENFRTTRIVRWFVAKEGFTAEAVKRLESEGVLTTDSVQLRIIKDSIEGRVEAVKQKEAGKLQLNKEFEVVLPSFTKAELVAAKAAEEIGTEMGFDENSIGQIKAALVEACINAFEHGKEKTGKVYLKFIASGDKLTIHVQNSGVDFEGPSPGGEGGGQKGPGAFPQKRGWGFELMKGLMDEVRVERVRGGAKIVLVKYLIRKGEARNDKEA